MLVEDCPEGRLVWYLLIDGIERWREGRKEALRWMLLEDEKPFSFRWTCNVVGLDPDWLRAELFTRRRDISFHGISVSQICKRM